MNSIKESLHNEIETEFEDLQGLDIGSDEYKVAVDGITKLVDRAIEIDKLEKEAEQKNKNHELEMAKMKDTKEIECQKVSISAKDLDLKREQTNDNKRDQLFRNGIAIAGIIIPSVITIWGTLKTLKFEETGTVTTIMGRGFVNKLIPKK